MGKLNRCAAESYISRSLLQAHSLSPIKGRARGASTARVEQYNDSFQARSFISSEGGLVDPRMRASNEGLLRPRVARAGGRPGYPPPLTPTPAHSPFPLLFLRTTGTRPAKPPTSVPLM